MVLAGGLGTRMSGVAGGLPKALIPVGGQPFAHHQLRLLARQGVTDVVYSIGHRGEMIRAAVGDGSAFGLGVRYVDEGERLRGTGGALRLCLDAGVLANRFLVLYGDSYLPIDLSPVLAAFESRRRPALMTVLRNDDRWDTSNVIYQDGQVVLYDKTRGGEGSPIAGRMQYIDYGLTLLTRAVVERLPADEVCDLAGLYRDLSLAGELAGFEVDQRFYEIGSPAGLRDLETHLAQGEHHGNSQH